MRVNWTVSMNHDVVIRFREYCYRKKQHQSETLEPIVVAFLDEKEKEIRSTPGSNEAGEIAYEHSTKVIE